MNTRNAIRIASLLAISAMASAGAQAASSYGNLAAPGVYFGAGNINGNWNIGSAGGIELGLRVKERPSGNLLDGSTGTYFADAGTYAGGGVKAKWNYEFSVNIGTLAYDGLTFKLGVDHDPSAATNYSFVNPQTYWFDNATVTVGANGSNGFQNSQNVGFGGTPGGAFNVSQNGLYSFSLEVFDAAGLMLDSTTMDVQVGAPVPEPETWALMLAGLAAVGAVARRRAKK